MPEWVAGYCRSCGAMNPPNDRLCGKCGESLPEVEPVPIPQPSSREIASELRERLAKTQVELQV